MLCFEDTNMNKKLWMIIAAAVFAGGATQSVLAEDAVMGDNPAAAAFQALDADQDSYISEQEASNDAELSERWAEIDTDQNGKIDRVEFSALDISESEEDSTPAE